ncbi:Arm domain-containing protein/U-box domain-containing protein [Cephalotus follicularis]|uniref:RING-type E3 ubiquitin transferase n=1 Tax=Cephalotus follicularis TaxID=3775 RepID=A0A1Q3C3K4_CEPFO|nr:Arm domain-containing protein/U-box domain-containing protein [Cephalotus follicularis]
MEFQEAVVKLMIKKPTLDKSFFERDIDKERPVNAKQKWKISFYRSSSSSSIASKRQQQPPKEFLCPISGSLMNDPVIVSSGHTFEKACVQACKTLGFMPTLTDNSTSDFSTVIPNLALKSTILSWCQKRSLDPPIPLEFSSAEKLVRTLMAAQNQNQNQILSEKSLIPSGKLHHAATDLTRRSNHFHSSSGESMATTVSTPPLQLATRLSCYSSPSSSEIETLNSDPMEEEMIAKMNSLVVFKTEEAVISLRKITRDYEDTRLTLCTPRLLSALRPLVMSRYTTIHVNSVAALVNLSLEKANKVKIVRSGIVPPLIDVLKGGSPEAQEHAAGALFSLALEDSNKSAIGVLGALQPLLHLLRSESERTRHDSAMALYHLSLVQVNRTKLVKLGSVPVLLGMVQSGYMSGWILLVLGSLASCVDGRAAMLDSGAVDCLVGILGGCCLSESARESCVAVLYWLSHGGLRFKQLAKASGAAEVLGKVVENGGSELGMEKAGRMLKMMEARGGIEEEEGMNWQDLLGPGFTSQTMLKLGMENGGSSLNSSEL